MLDDTDVLTRAAEIRREIALGTLSPFEVRRKIRAHRDVYLRVVGRLDLLELEVFGP